MNTADQHAAALAIVHEEAGRTLSREDFDLCMRIAKRALAPSHATQVPDLREQAAKIAERHNYTGAGIDAARKIRALAAPVANAAHAEPAAELVKCSNMTGREWFDIKVRDRSLPHGALLYAAAPEQPAVPLTDDALVAARAVVREELDAVCVPPCDEHNDEVRSRQLSAHMRRLYRALLSHTEGETR